MKKIHLLFVLLCSLAVMTLSSCRTPYGVLIFNGIETNPTQVYVNEPFEVIVFIFESSNGEKPRDWDYTLGYKSPEDSQVHEVISETRIFKDLVFTEPGEVQCYFKTNYPDKSFKSCYQPFVINVLPERTN